MYLKPYSLLKIGKWLGEAGYEVALVNALDYTEEQSLLAFGSPKRYSNGTGKFFRTVVPKPQALAGTPRFFARYGILRSVIEEKIRSFHPDIVLVNTGMTYWYLGVQEAVECVRRVLPRVPVVLGGIYATLCAPHARASLGPDCVVEGPALPALASFLEARGLPVPGHPLSEDPLFIREGFLEAAAIRLHSGCPYSCAYCASRLVSGAYQVGKGERLFKTVASIHQTFGINDFCFYDDALLVDPHDGIIPFLWSITESGLQLRFYVPNGLHVALMTEEIARLMKRSGVRDFKLGFESAAEEFHATHDNKHTRAMFARALAHLEAGGYSPREIAVYVLAGLPRQDRGEVEESIRFAASFGIKVFVAEYSPIPGTLLWEKAVAFSSFPIETEPLTQNNTIFPMQWEGFTRTDMYNLKQLARTLTREQG
jgi:radical SAM superfamily enzyme YgiQ (UPF0313 family)